MTIENVDQIRNVFEDNGIVTIDDFNFDSLFLADYGDDESPMALDWICGEYDLNWRRIDSDIVAIDFN